MSTAAASSPAPFLDALVTFSGPRRLAEACEALAELAEAPCPALDESTPEGFAALEDLLFSLLAALGWGCEPHVDGLTCGPLF